MEKRKVVVIREDILSDEHLTPADKLIYARISAFENYFESAEACAELLRVSVSAVQKAKAKLETLGYITCIKNTGRGKVYRTNLDWLSDSQDLPIRLAKSANQDSKICEHSIDREEIELDTKVSKAQSQDDEQKEFGNSEINAIFKAWSDAGLPAITSRAQQSRRTIWNMLRNKQIGAERLKHGIELAGEAYGEPYAPTVFNFEDLNRKLTALEAWKQKQTVLAEKPKTQPSPSSYSPTYSGEIAYERRPYDQRPSILDQEQVTEVFSDDFYEEMRQRVHGKRKENNNE